MSQLNETWASLTQDERDEMNEKDRKGRIKSLAMKYGRRRVDAAQKEVETDAKRTGRNTKKKPITWRELQSRIENTKSKLKPGEVRKWDKAKGKWVSNKEDMDEAVMTPAQKRKDSRLKKKYEKSDTMMDNFKDQYGEKEGKSVFYAYIRKKAMEKK